MKLLLLVGILMSSTAAFAQEEKSACSLNYNLIEDSSAAIFYYEITKYDSKLNKFTPLKQWYCDDANVQQEVKSMLNTNCSLINIDGVAIKPNEKGSYDLSFGCG